MIIEHSNQHTAAEHRRLDHRRKLVVRRLTQKPGARFQAELRERARWWYARKIFDAWFPSIGHYLWYSKAKFAQDMRVRAYMRGMVATLLQPHRWAQDIHER